MIFSLLETEHLLILICPASPWKPKPVMMQSCFKRFLSSFLTWCPWSHKNILFWSGAFYWKARCIAPETSKNDTKKYWYLDITCHVHRFCCSATPNAGTGKLLNLKLDLFCRVLQTSIRLAGSPMGNLAPTHRCHPIMVIGEVLMCHNTIPTHWLP